MSSFLSHRRKAFRGGVAFDGFGNASRSFDGTDDYINLGDSDDLSFGDGSSDSAFSISAWVKMTDATHFRIINKFGGTSNNEYLFDFGGNDLLYAICYDQSAGGARIGRTASGLNVHEGSWLHVAMTYDGSASSTGINIYATEFSGTTSAVDDADFNSGSYTAMENLNQTVRIARNGSNYAEGNIADVRIYSKELSSAEVQSLADGTHVTDSLVGWWLDDDDDVLDNAGTNDGTNSGSTYNNTDAHNL